MKLRMETTEMLWNLLMDSWWSLSRIIYSFQRQLWGMNYVDKYAWLSIPVTNVNTPDIHRIPARACPAPSSIPTHFHDIALLCQGDDLFVLFLQFLHVALLQRLRVLGLSVLVSLMLAFQLPQAHHCNVQNGKNILLIIRPKWEFIRIRIIRIKG